MQTDAAIDIPTSSTIMAWAWIQNLYTGADPEYGADFIGWSDAGGDKYLNTHIQNNAYIQYLVSEVSGNYRWWNAGTAMGIGEWVHVAIASTDTNAPAMYINGSLIGNAQWISGGTVSRPTSRHFGLSRISDDSNARMNMWIGEVRVYAEAVASNNVKTVYDASSGDHP